MQVKANCSTVLDMTLSDKALILGATMRLTRLVVADDLGQWWVKDPIDRLHHEGKLHVDHKYLGGLECPFCVGYWIGAGVLVSYHLAPRRAWRFVAASLTLNEVAAHLGARLGDTAN